MLYLELDAIGDIHVLQTSLFSLDWIQGGQLETILKLQKSGSSDPSNRFKVTVSGNRAFRGHCSHSDSSCFSCLVNNSVPISIPQVGYEAEGEARRYFVHAITLRDTVRFLRYNKNLCSDMENGAAVDLIRCESLLSLDPSTRARVLNKNYR